MLRLPPFRYRVPRDLAEAVALKGELGPRAAWAAGGTSLYPAMKRRQQEPETVIPVHELPELRRVERADGTVRLGAAQTLAEIAARADVQAAWPALADAAGRVATPLVRNLATLGGNLCLDTRCSFYDQSLEWRQAIEFCLKKSGECCRVADASDRCWAIQCSDLAPLMIAIGAAVELRGPSGTRVVAAGEFYHDDGIRYLNKHPDELVTTVVLPVGDGGEAVVTKVSRRVSFDFPVLSVAAWVRRDGPGGEVREARIVLGAVGSAPVRAVDAAAALVGRRLDAESIAAAADAAWRAVRPLDNADQTGLWRKTVARPHVARTLRRLAGIAT